MCICTTHSAGVYALPDRGRIRLWSNEFERDRAAEDSVMFQKKMDKTVTVRWDGANWSLNEPGGVPP